MTRRDSLLSASDKAQCAVTAIITARAFERHNPARQQALLIEAEAALYAAIDLIWQSSDTSSDRSLRIAGEITADLDGTQQERLVA